MPLLQSSSDCDKSHARRPAVPGTIPNMLSACPVLPSPRKVQITMRFSRFLSPIAIALLGSFPVAGLATPEKAATYYEDALRRYEKDDIPAAVIQLKNAIQQDQKMLAAHLLLGKSLLKDGDLKGAEAAFEEALKQGVNRGEVVIPLGQVYLALGRPEVVIDRIQPTGLSPALQVEVLTMRGNAYMEAGKNSMAAQSWDQAKAIDPKSALPLIAEIPVLLAAGRVDQARDKANKAVELAPNNASAWNMKAAVLHRSLDIPGALSAYGQALSIAPKHVDARIARSALLIDLKRDTEASKDLDFLKTFAADEPRAAYLRAVLAGQKGNSEETAEALKEVSRTIDALPPDWLLRREQLLMAAALSHYGQGNYQKAREYLDAILSRSPNHTVAKKLLAAVYIATKDYGRAQPHLEALLRMMPEDPQLLYMLGSVNLAQRRYAQAADQLERAASRSDAPEMNRSLGFSLLAMGQSQKSASTLEKTFAANPSDIQAGMALASTYLRLGNKGRALNIAEAMVKRAPDNPVSLNFLAATKNALGDKAGARATYNQAVTKDSGFVPAVLNLVRMDAEERHFDAARQRLDALLKKEPDNARVLYEYGLLEQKAGRLKEAIRHLKKAGEVQRIDSAPTLALIDLYLAERESTLALEKAKDLSGRFSGDVRVMMSLARSYLAVKDEAGARTTLSSATRLAEFDARKLVGIARLQMSANDLNGAAYSLSKALQGTPDNLSALSLAVYVEARRGEAAKTDVALKALVAKHPDALETIRTMADLAFYRGQHQAAITGYRKLLGRQENSANAMALVNTYMAADEAGKAVAFLETWLKKNPTDIVALKLLAEAQFRSGQLDAAKKSYQKAVTTDPNDASTLNNYANLLLRLNDPEALNVADKAVRLAPGVAVFSDTLGWIHVKQGQPETALRYLREARLRSPENREIRFHLAYALAKMGRATEAREELGVALNGLKHPPESTELAELKKILDWKTP